jgi:hypothetical protein
MIGGRNMVLPLFRQAAKVSLWFTLLVAIMWICPVECGGVNCSITMCESTQGVWDIVVNGHVVLRMRYPNGGISPAERATCVVQRLQEVLETSNAEDIKPAVAKGSFAVVAGQKHIVTVDGDNAKANSSSCYELALKWANNMRVALGGSPVSNCDIDHLVSLETVYPYEVSVARASWYGGRWNGRLTANGEIYDEMSLTAAHRSLPFGSIVRVTNLLSGKQVVVRINNRGPYIKGRAIDLSRAAAEAIGLVGPGVGDVAIEVISSGKQDRDR